MRSPMIPLRLSAHVALAFLAVLLSAPCHHSAHAQPLASPYAFAIDHDVDLDSALLGLPSEVAGAKGRVVLTSDGHLGFSNGERLRLSGTTLQWFSVFPDSAGAIVQARRLRALGINCVRLNTFDISLWPPVSIFLPTSPTTVKDGLDPEQMKKFDWFMHQLRLHGIYYVFTFQSVWTPRANDGVLQPDSTGFGARVPVIFNRRIQQIGRDVMRALLSHVNQFSGTAYKDDPALAYVIAAEDASAVAFWLYTNDVIRPNPSGSSSSTGAQHVAHIDSLWNAWLASTYSTDAALGAAWAATAKSTQNLVVNGDFEDPFNSIWQFNINSTTGAQALFQFSDADKQQGTSCGRVRVNKLDPSKSSYMIQLVQRLPLMRHLQTYELTFWAKTTPQRGSRSVFLYVFNGTAPYNTYGLATTQQITSQWAKYTYTFAATVTDSTTAALGFFVGADSGDVFIDDVQFREVSRSGLRSGESITKRNIRMSPMLDEVITIGRSKDNARFVYENLRRFLGDARRLVRDTLKSSVLMCPSVRLTSFFELDAAREYEVFSSVDWRSDARSPLLDAYGAGFNGPAQVRPKGKAFVMSHVSVQHPHAYGSELMAVHPAYAGLQDWDGVFFSVFSDNGRIGSAVIDSNDYWMLRNKPNLLSLLPWTSSMMRSGAIAPSQKEVVIDHTAESVQLPRLNIQSAFGLIAGTDPRIPLFRRVSVNQELKQQASFLPHLEVSALSGEVDLAALDAENEQIFRDATSGVMRIDAPTHAAIMGPLGGKIVSTSTMSVEQTTPAPHALVAVASQSGMPIAESERSLLTISTRVLNQGAIFNASNDNLRVWGKGPVQMEGVSMRITLTAPTFDSLTIRPLGADGRPSGTPIGVAKRTGGKFTTLLSTFEHRTPWYRLEFSRRTTSVAGDEPSSWLTVHDSDLDDEPLVFTLAKPAAFIGLIDSRGASVVTGMDRVGTTSMDVGHLASGLYRLVVRYSTGESQTASVLIR
ncbi:MAG: hypothetical protein FGM33_02685 [Candidatus Kapabacteria bacterium]|nr:hypothetical protein [Candidatus Kapabacteria bacterium]